MREPIRALGKTSKFFILITFQKIYVDNLII